MDEIVKEYLIESNEALDCMDRELVALEKEPSSRELLATIFRAIHTVKGTSGSLGYSKIESVAHVGENLLSRMRDGDLILTAEITSALLAMTDVLRRMLASIEETEEEGEFETGSVTDALHRILQNSTGMNNPSAAGSDKTGEILVERGAVSESLITSVVKMQEQGDARKIGDILVEEAGVSPLAIADALSVQAERRQQVTTSAIRVDVNLLDKVMNLVGELVLARNQVLQFTTNTEDSSFLRTAQRLNLITTELQEGVMKTRMQPIENIWKSFPRVVRDISLAGGKLAELEMEGAETELDKTIIEAIKDPLTHIVRNSVDHGIELPSVRQQAGKPPCGTVKLRAFHEGGQVNIVISDDGAGVDCARVRAKALEKQLVTPQQLTAMSDLQVMNLLFLPGFSTAAKVTNISGRGVGMDVVKTNIEKIGGTVAIDSVQGKGTTIKIRIPLTLAIIPALLVMSGGERFAIPQVSLVELVRLEGEAAISKIEMIHGAPVHRLRGKLLPLLSLNRQLNLPATVAGADDVPVVNIVVLQADGRQFGLIVDDINDTEEIVVKPLGKQLKGIHCFAGATILGDGRVALILDVPGLAQRAKLGSETQAQEVLDERKKATAESADAQSWLLFRVGNKGRLAIPLSTVSRLEEFDLAAIEVSDQRSVIQYRNAIMPLIFISDMLHLQGAREDESRFPVIVYSEGGKDIGLAVDEILDIVDEHVEYSNNTASDYLLGSAVLQARVTDLLNVPAIVDGFMRSSDFIPEERAEESIVYVN
ncbi:MAG: histidine kinase [Acidobacteria bacterium]|nr:MAG: histidine kinase [Acidobacteriota bacterium]